MNPSRNGKIQRVLITNDDGINATGLKVLEDIAHGLADEVWVFAPDNNCSGSGRSLTLNRDLKITAHTPQRFSCDGTPADCIVLAVGHYMLDSLPDLVLSGVNLGMNVADDITCSGTIGAAWEACVHNIPAIALSQKINTKHPPEHAVDAYAITREAAPSLLKSLLQNGWGEDIILNINFPFLPANGIKATEVGRHKASDEIIPLDADHAFRIGLLRQRRERQAGGYDYDDIMNDYITVTPLALNMTHSKELNRLENLFAKQ
ncbi:MAG: 5'/3'-nucleotidase SurE [Proteobacteria bacterium]|nr:5'/3'-nucleotidase SurE [Pseudomonadota bacterium]